MFRHIFVTNGASMYPIGTIPIPSDSLGPRQGFQQGLGAQNGQKQVQNDKFNLKMLKNLLEDNRVQLFELAGTKSSPPAGRPPSRRRPAPTKINYRLLNSILRWAPRGLPRASGEPRCPKWSFVVS